MTIPPDRADPPMAEPGKRSSAGDLGGIRATADAGLSDSLQRSSERSDESGVGRAATGDASDSRGAPSSGARGAAPAGGGASRNMKEDDEDEWRHAPIAPVDESNPLKSLGKAVGDAVTGSGPDATTPPTSTRR